MTTAQVLTNEEKAIARRRQKERLGEIIAEWRARLEKALLRVENRWRQETNRSPLPDSTIVWIATGPIADLHLLNLYIWTQRYCVSPEFIIEFMLKAFRRQRTFSRNTNEIHLGIAPNVLGGTRARQALEEEIAIRFPTGENYRLARQPQPEFINIVKAPTLEQGLKNYAVAAQRAQMRFDRKMASAETSSPSPRNYRRTVTEKP